LGEGRVDFHLINRRRDVAPIQKIFQIGGGEIGHPDCARAPFRQQFLGGFP
jgi:hypothetical protein